MRKNNLLKHRALEFARECKNLLFCTIYRNIPYSRPMQLVEDIDDNFVIWLATSATSQKVKHLKENSTTCSTLSDLEKSVQIIGSGEIVTDTDVKAKKWNNEWNTYWPKREFDPNYVLIKINPIEVNFHEKLAVRRVPL